MKSGERKSGARNVRCDKSGEKREKWGETKVRRVKSGARKSDAKRKSRARKVRRKKK